MLKRRKIDKTLKEIGEKNFLSLIRNYVDSPILEFGDDASAIELPSGDLLVINADMLVQTTDVLPGMSYSQMGKKAVVMSVSDIVAKGSYPLGCLASVGFPKEMKIQHAENIIAGIKEKCLEYTIPFLGGDLNESIDVIVDIISFGLSNSNKLIPRKGAKNGSLLYSTGLFGLTTIGFKLLLNKPIPISLPSNLKEKVLSAVYSPKARVDFLQLFSQNNIEVCMDSSDGLAVTLKELSEINKLGINLTHVPVHPLVEEASSGNHQDTLNFVFNGGEEFELIFAISPSQKDKLEMNARKIGLKIHKIGYFTEKEQGIIITDTKYANVDFVLKGYEHYEQ
ncbi:MAG: thiamine-phosphate kinase [Candidatus Heimdallarchaeaceae archaeon]